MATLKEIAKRVGVSASEVSRVLNGAERLGRSVSEETRRKILQAAEALDYRPNLIARALVTQRTQVVGAALYNLSNPFFGRMAMGIETELRSQGLQTLLSTAELSESADEIAELDWEAYLRTFLRYNVAGIVFWNWAPFTRADQATWQAAGEGRPPLVLMGRAEENVTMDRVAIDHSYGGRLVTEHLLALGHRRIAYVGNDTLWPTPYSKFQGYAAALANAGLAPEVLADDVVSLEAGLELGRALTQREDRPTAVVASNDYLAVGLIRAAFEAGWRVPEQLAVTGFDDNPLSAYGAVSLTTVSPPYQEAARVAVELLVERIESRRNHTAAGAAAQTAPAGSQGVEPPAAGRGVLLRPTLVVRESSAGTRAFVR